MHEAQDRAILLGFEAFKAFPGVNNNRLRSGCCFCDRFGLLVSAQWFKARNTPDGEWLILVKAGFTAVAVGKNHDFPATAMQRPGQGTHQGFDTAGARREALG